MPARTTALALFVLGSTLVAGCGSGDGSGGGDAGGDRLQVEAAFYPLQWVADEVGGDRVSVANLTRPGVEPHDLELTPRDVAAVSDADVVVYLSGFQPAVDDAVAGSDATTFDVSDAAQLDRTLDDAHEDQGDHGDDGDDEGAGDAAVDPHFWLDPTKLAAVATDLARALGEEDPDGAEAYRANAEDLVARLTTLDGEFEAGLADCRSRELVTSHEAFGYLADRYDLEQIGISGLSPNQEPSAADLAEVTEFVREREVRTIYFETLVSPEVAETVAAEAGVGTAVLDPLEGLTDDSPGTDYLEVMRSNLTSLQDGQPCP